jgi:AcrB/AcrD/AcrF family
LERAKAKLKIVVPFTLLIIFVLLYLILRRFNEALLVLATLPFALIGGFWFIYLLGREVSIGPGGFRRISRWVHRACRRRRGVRCCHAHLLEAGVGCPRGIGGQPEFRFAG